MLLAELNVRHTRRHMPTRRVALDGTYLPTSGPAYGGVLLGAVVVEHVEWLDEEQQEMLPKLLREARDGLTVPRIAMRYRLQTDTHGLDRSRHRIVGEDTPTGTRTVLELDCHGRSAPQVIGAVMAAAALPEPARLLAMRAIDAALRAGGLPEGFVVRRMLQGVPGLAPFAPGMRPTPAANGVDPWRGVPAERRWAMEVLGLKADMAVAHGDVQARFRRLARLAHPDHGASPEGAAERLAELAEARALLLGVDAIASERAG